MHRLFPILPLAALPLLSGPAAAADQPIARLADLRAGATVTVAGTVVGVPDYDEFVLEDATGRIAVYVGPNDHGLAGGETVTVTGRLDDDWPREIYARSLTGPAGSRAFDHRGD